MIRCQSKKLPKKNPQIKLGSEYDVYSEFDFIAGLQKAVFLTGLLMMKMNDSKKDHAVNLALIVSAFFNLAKKQG